MASSVMASVGLKPSSLMFEKSAAGRSIQFLAGTSSFKVEVNGGKKRINDGMSLMDGVDSSRTKAMGKVGYQHVENYGDNMDGCSPIYNTDVWSPSGDVYVGGTTGLAICAVTLAGSSY